MTQIPASVYRPDIAILTALPKEHAAVRALLDQPIPHTQSDRQGTRHYTFGSMPARDGGKHALALALVGVGNNISAAATMQLLADLPSVHTVVLSGIAGGVPNPQKAEDHVRLGDIVVSGEYGIIQYDFLKRETDQETPRHPPRPPSSNLVRAARVLEADAISGARPWDELIERALRALGWKRPPALTDLLADSADPARFARHPRDPARVKGKPRIFLGPIASANTLMKNPIRRDELRDTYGVKAVEMEGSGSADAAWMAQAHHFVIRGICDYCDSRKGDIWQNYAAAAAAGYLRTLLGKIDPASEARPPERTFLVRPGAARKYVQRAGEPSPNDEISRHVDEAKSRLYAMMVDAGNEVRLLIPALSWMGSIDRKLHQDRLLDREAQAAAAVCEEICRTDVVPAGSRLSPIERLSLNLLDKYQENSLLRANWEVRCAIGNLLTSTVAKERSKVSVLITEAMHASVPRENWDLAQMLFDALHHAEKLTKSGRDFLISAAIEHEHRQVRWNVAAALKSIRLPAGDLRVIIDRLLRDQSEWVVKEVVDVGLKNDAVLSALSSPGHAGLLRDVLGRDLKLLAHVLLSVDPTARNRLLPQFEGLLHRSGSAGKSQFRREFSRVVGVSYSSIDAKILKVDFRRVEQLKSRLNGQHGRLYKAAERVVFDRMTSGDLASQQHAITAYLNSTHEALAWASVRALFSGKLDLCDDEFLRSAISNMLTHPSEWIRRECVEEALRLDDGRRKYIALRQIELHKEALAEVDEVRPYLVQIGMRREAANG